MDENIGENLKIARQPIYTQNGEVFAYELLYRPMSIRKVSETSKTKLNDDAFTTLKVVANSLLMGLDKLTENKRAFINFGQQLLLNKIPALFSSDSIGIEIVERVKPEPELIQSCKELKANGFPIILDDFVYSKGMEKFIEIADIIKIDFLSISFKERQKTIKMGKKYKLKFLAEKIETEGQYRLALKEGFDYFQGYYFSKPDIVSIPNIPGYKINYMNILKTINKPKPDIEMIEEVLKREISLTYRLLKTIYQLYGNQKKISTIREAIEILGIKNIKNTLSLIVISSIGRDKPNRLLNNALIRAKFYELIAINTGEENYKCVYYFIGMLSMLDIFLEKPMEILIKYLPLKSEVIEALKGKRGKYYNVMRLVESFENKDENKINIFSEKVGISINTLNELYITAIETGNLHY